MLRSATAADSDWCYHLHRAAFHDYVEAIWGWDERVQRTFHDRAFRPDITRIISADGAPVGAVSVERTDSVTYLGRTTIDPTIRVAVSAPRSSESSSRRPPRTVNRSCWTSWSSTTVRTSSTAASASTSSTGTAEQHQDPHAPRPHLTKNLR